MIVAIGAVLLLVRRPHSRSATASLAAAALFELAVGSVPVRELRSAASRTLPLALFLTAAIWLARLAEQAGLTERIATIVARCGRGRPPLLYLLVCTLCALLTAAVSLDGAVVLMVPLVSVLAGGAPALRRPLLLATVAVANAFSLAVPEGNPTNLVFIERFGLAPGAFVAHLFVPSLLATTLCAAAVAHAERRRLRGRYELSTAPPGPPTPAAKRAGATIAAAAAASALVPLLGIAPWWPLIGVAALAFTAAHARRSPVPPIPVPWRLTFQIGALLVLASPLASLPNIPTSATSLLPLLALALAAAAAAGAANNLPASVLLAGGLAGTRGVAVYAALTGLSVGALATPHGSVATLIALDGADDDGATGHTGRYLKLWLPTATLATATATTGIWLLAGTGRLA